MNYAEYVKTRFISLKSSDVVLSRHAIEQALVRGIQRSDILQNILSPKRLVFAGRQDPENPCEEKFDCFFEYQSNHSHRYIVVLHSRCIVCTVVQLHRSWRPLVKQYEDV